MSKETPDLLCLYSTLRGWINDVNNAELNPVISEHIEYFFNSAFSLVSLISKEPEVRDWSNITIDISVIKKVIGDNTYQTLFDNEEDYVDILIVVLRHYKEKFKDINIDVDWILFWIKILDGNFSVSIDDNKIVLIVKSQEES